MGRKIEWKKLNLQTQFLSLGKLMLLSGILVTVFLFSVILGMRFAVQGLVLQTPQLVGMSRSEAEDLFGRLKLNLVISGERYDLFAPPGRIISQSPGPGVGIKADRQVSVVVSLGRRTNAIPDLSDRSLRAARLIAEQNGFQIGNVTEIAYSGEEDTILGQSPSPDSVETVDNRIDVLVRKEPHKDYVMPDLIGINMNKVLLSLKEHGFETRVFYRSHPGIKRGSVVRQFPEPGYLLRDDELINLEVAR